MAKAELKTKKTSESVPAFLAKIENDEARKDSKTLVGLMEKATGAKARMWGKSIVGFGDYRYRYASGREGDWFVMGFAPRKGMLSLYLLGDVRRHGDLLKKLGKHKTGMGCLYIRRLGDVDGGVLKKLLSVTAARAKKGEAFS